LAGAAVAAREAAVPEPSDIFGNSLPHEVPIQDLAIRKKIKKLAWQCALKEQLNVAAGICRFAR
jgi:hypothetical protein